MHLKRQKVPKKWPIARKGTKYVIRPDSNISEGIPLLVFLRDLIKVAQNRKEVKKAIHEKNILINSKPAKNEKNTILLFDKITIIPSKRYFNLNLNEYGKFVAKEITEIESHQKISKIMDKKILKGKKIQLNLSDGRNYLTQTKCNVNDSVLIDFQNKKIKNCLPLKEKSNIIVFAGKHTGKRGVISKIIKDKMMAELTTEKNKKKINVLIKQIMVIE